MTVSIIITGALVLAVMLGVDKMMEYGKENNLYINGYLNEEAR